MTIELLEKVEAPKKTCQHHWLIEPEPGDGRGNLKGVCRNCGEVRMFKGCRQAWEMIGDVLGKRQTVPR